MNEYETEEQQIEALKGWWKENGTSLILGLAVGVSGLFGWRYYVQQDNLQAVLASDLYMQVMQQVSEQHVTQQNMDDTIFDINNQLINEFSNTPYAALSSLVLAKYEYEKGNVDAAIAQLELAVKHASDDQIKQISSLRLARLYIEQEKYTEAQSLLNEPHDAAFGAQFEELKGDLHNAKGDAEQARIAYDKAIALQGMAASKWLKLKRQNLGA
ncbi:tetratricopeptide repeat protein [Cardiobacterium sp. AH-315-I02]|nr:tetratricopeptide repeat protein [Cardiobacterium sp. AH-315-I02]